MNSSEDSRNGKEVPPPQPQIDPKSAKRISRWENLQRFLANPQTKRGQLLVKALNLGEED